MEMNHTNCTHAKAEEKGRAATGQAIRKSSGETKFPPTAKGDFQLERRFAGTGSVARWWTKLLCFYL